MIINTQNKLKKIKISNKFPQPQQLKQSKMVYFRCSNKMTYTLFIKDELKINLVKTVLSSLISAPTEMIRLIHKGQQIAGETQLQNLPPKSVVHVVVQSKESEEINVLVNFFGKNRKKYLIKCTTKVRDLVYFIRKNNSQLRNKAFLLVYLGKVVDLSMNFNQNLIGNNAELYAVDISIQKSTVSSIKDQIKEIKLNNQVAEEKQAKIQKRNHTNELNIPISNIFDIHSKPTKLIDHSVTKKQAHLVKKEQRNDQITYTDLKSCAKAQTFNFQQNDFMFAAFEILPQSEDFIKNTINEMKQAFLLKKQVK